jgi:hypothetical protein
MKTNLSFCLCLLVALLMNISHAAQPPNQAMLLGYNSNFATLNGLKVHYLQKGEGEKIIFFHGYPFFAASWDNLLTHFSSDYRKTPQPSKL